MSPESASANTIKTQSDRGNFVYRVGGDEIVEIAVHVFRWKYSVQAICRRDH